MEITTTYIISQILIIINYIFLIITYQLKSRRSILMLNFGALIMTGLSYLFLSAYTGLAMVLVAIIRNIYFLYDEKKYGKKDINTKKDVIILIVLFAISIIFSIFTYNGFLSLMSVFATMLYTYSVWQKNTTLYKILGIPVSLIWIVYNIYILSIFGIILEVLLILSAIIGFIKENKRRNIKNEIGL